MVRYWIRMFDGYRFSVRTVDLLESDRISGLSPVDALQLDLLAEYGSADFSPFTFSVERMEILEGVLECA